MAKTNRNGGHHRRPRSNAPIKFPTQPLQSGPADGVTVPEESDGETMNFRKLSAMMKQGRDMIGFLENTWFQLKEEFQINEEQLQQVLAYNEKVREPLPPVELIPQLNDDGEPVLGEDGEPIMIGKPDEREYDPLNGLTLITPEKLQEIFGSDSPLYGVDRSQTMDRLRHATNLFFTLYRAHADYRDLEKEFNTAVDQQEADSVQALRDRAATEEDPDKKAAAQKALDQFLDTKYLEFLPRLTEGPTKKYLLKAFHDQNRIKYALQRAREYMQRMEIPEKFILEISSFEKRYLDEKYHAQNNILLLFFLNLLVYNNVATDQLVRQQVMSFVIGMDKLIRNSWPDADREKVMASIIAFEDMFTSEIGGNVDGTKG